jgi:hypothetical protein
MRDSYPNEMEDYVVWDRFIGDSVTKLFRAINQDFTHLKWTGEELIIICPSGEEMTEYEFVIDSATRGLYRLVSQWLWTSEVDAFTVEL